MGGLTGSTDAGGELGRRVAERLSRRGAAQRLVVNGDTAAPDLPGADVRSIEGVDDVEALTTALEGVETLFLVPIKERADRARVHAASVDAALAAGVSRVVYSSFVGAAADSAFTLARDHYATEQHIRASGIPFTFVRGSAFLEVLHWIVGADGVIRGPGGTGRLAPVSRDDLADVLAGVLATPAAHEGRTYDVTGPQALSLSDIAAVFAAVSGRRVTYVEETPEEAVASRQVYGAPDWQVRAWVSTYLQIANGDLDVVSDTVPRLTGHRATALADYLSQHPADYEHLLSP